METARIQAISCYIPLYYPSILGTIISCLHSDSILAGWRRGNKWRVLLLTRRQNWFDALLDILEYPNPSLYVLKLEMLVPRIERDISIFEEEQVCTDDKAPNLDLEAIRSEAEEEVDFSCAFTDVNTYHLHVLKKLHNIILNSTDQLKRIKDDVELIEIAGIMQKHSVPGKMRFLDT